MKNAKQSSKEFIDENTAKNTKKTNLTVRKLFDQFMKEFDPTEERTFDDLPSEILGPKVCKFFQVINHENGTEYNASSLETYYRAMVRILSEREIIVNTDPNFKDLRTMSIIYFTILIFF